MADLRQSSLRDKGQQKFSKTETKRIIDAIEDYIEVNNLQITDVCSNLRSSKVLKRHSIWKDLGLMFPERSRKNIYTHAMRKLFRKYHSSSAIEPDGTKRDKFFQLTEEEKVTLQELVASKGKKWAVIAREMGHFEDDLKDMYYRLKGRLNQGNFSVDENVELIRSIQSHTNTRGRPITDIPLHNLPWLAIAEDLGDKRFKEDYQRHWIVLKHSLLFGWGTEGFKSNKTEHVMITSKRKYQEVSGTLALLRAKSMIVIESLLALNDENGDDDGDDEGGGGITDESEVNWTRIGQQQGLSYGDALRRWKVLCKECPSSINSDDFQAKLHYLAKKYHIRNSTATASLKSAGDDNNEDNGSNLTRIHDGKDLNYKDETHKKIDDIMNDIFSDDSDNDDNDNDDDEDNDDNGAKSNRHNSSKKQKHSHDEVKSQKSGYDRKIRPTSSSSSSSSSSPSIMSTHNIATTNKTVKKFSSSTSKHLDTFRTFNKALIKSHEDLLNESD